jgi:hypothetical protein
VLARDLPALLDVLLPRLAAELVELLLGDFLKREADLDIPALDAPL